jgi:xanthine dehydrogenase molybdenum-binding subunit
VVRATFTTQRIEHLFLEPERALAEALPDGRVALSSQGQGIFDDRRQVASILGVPDERVLVTLVPGGGAFGGKEDLSVQGHAALLAQRTGRPVMLGLTREQSIRVHPKRHPMTLAYEVGCDAEGRLTAVRARITGDTGAHASVGAKVLERAAGHAAGPYRVPCVDVEARAVATNNPPCGAMRGFGVPQVTFAMEGCLDELAAKVGLDRWEMRWRNAIDAGDVVTTGQRVDKSVGIKKTLLAVKSAYDAARMAGLPVGIACGLKNSGIGNGVPEWGRARLVVEGDGTVTVWNGYSEMGQGLSTVLAQIASEATGLPARVFAARTDTHFALDCGQTTGSRATLFGGGAVLAAARKLRADLDRGAALGDLAGRVYAADELTDDTTPLGADVPSPKTHTSYGFATQVVVLDREGRLIRVVAAHDVGRAVNPAMCSAQVEGAIAMGLGYALSEELRCEDGMPATFHVRELGALRARDVPPIEVILVEEPEPEGPYGAKGVGEIGMVPTAAAVAGALAAHDGVRRRALPMRDTKAAAALGVGHLHRHETAIHAPHAHARGRHGPGEGGGARSEADAPGGSEPRGASEGDASAAAPGGSEPRGAP